MESLLASRTPPRAKLNAVGFVCLLVFANLALLLSAAPAAAGLSPGTTSAGVVKFVGLDGSPLFDKDGAGPTQPEVFGYGQNVFVRLTDADLLDDEIRLRVKSTSDTTGEEVVLERLGPRGGMSFGSAAASGSFDLNLPAYEQTTGQIIYVDSDGSTTLNAGDAVYYSFQGHGGAGGTVAVGDIRLLPAGSAGTRVAAGNADAGAAAELAGIIYDGTPPPAGVGVLAVGDSDGNGRLDPVPDVLFLDMDNSGTTSPGDLALSGPNAGTRLGAGVPSNVLDLGPLAQAAFAYVDDDGSSTYTAGDGVILDADGDGRVSHGDVRFTPLANTVTYLGSIGFETTDIPGNGELYVKADDKVTVVYVDSGTAGPGTAAGVSEDSIVWRETRDGTVALDRADYFGIEEEIEITVEDQDIPTAQTTFCVRVTSDSDERGFNMTLRKVSDGRYRGNLKMTYGASDNMIPAFPNDTPCGGSNPVTPLGVSPFIQVKNGDFIQVKYTTPGFDERGRLEDNEVEALFHETNSGRIQWVTMDYKQVVSEDPNTPSPTDNVRVVQGVDTGRRVDTSNGWLRVEDRDLQGRGKIVVNVRTVDPSGNPAISADVDPTGLQVTLYETGAPRGSDFGKGTGEFIGFVGFHTDPPKPGQPASLGDCDPGTNSECRLRVKPDAIVIARYDDQNNANGDFQIVESRVRWKQTVTGTVDFKTDNSYGTSAATYNVTWAEGDPGDPGATPPIPPSGCQDPATGDWFDCHPNRGFVEVVDTDLKGQGDLWVRVTSSRDPLGIPLRLLESPTPGNPCSPSCNTGVFRGDFGFNATHSSSAEGPNADQILWAKACDSITVRYDDAANLEGKFEIVTDSLENVFTLEADDAGDDTAKPCGNQNKVWGGLLGNRTQRSISIRETATSTGSPQSGIIYGYRSAWVHLFDGEMNRDPTKVETNWGYAVVAAEKSLPAQWLCCNNLYTFQNAIETADIQKINVTLTETGPDTSKFVGEFTFVEGAADALRNYVNVTDGEQVCAYWLFRNTTLQNLTLRQGCVEWRETFNGSIEFRSAEHQGTSMNNNLTTVPEARVFYNGTGKRWDYVQDLDQLNTNQAWVFVRDYEDHPDVDSSINSDTIEVQLRSETDQKGISVTLYERYGRQAMPPCGSLNSGPGAGAGGGVTYGGFSSVFGGLPCTVPGTADGKIPDRDFYSFQDDRGFIGVFNLTTEGRFERDSRTGVLKGPLSDDRNDTLLVADGDTITGFYVDPNNRTGVSTIYVAFVDWQETDTATLKFDREVYRNNTNPSNPLNVAEITLTDKDLDTDVNQQQVMVRVLNDETSKEVQVMLEETGPTTGVFTGRFRFTSTPGAGVVMGADTILEVSDEVTFTAYYTDLRDKHGVTQRLTTQGQWFDTTSTRLTLDMDEYVSYSATGTITLEDANLDLKTGLDEVFVWVVSESDGGGEFLKLTETGARTGIFKAPIAFESVRTEGNGKLHVRDGDEFYAYYLDTEKNQKPALNDDVLVKTATAKFRILPNQAPQINVTTIPPVNQELGYLPIHVGSSVAISVETLDLDGTVERFEMDLGDNSPIIRNVDGRGSNDMIIVHAYGAEPFYDGWLQQRSHFMTVRAWDDHGAMSTHVIEVKAINPDKDPPGGINDLSVVEDATLADSITLEFTAPDGNENCGGDPGCGGPARVSTYEVFYSDTDLADDDIFNDLHHPTLNPNGKTFRADDVVFLPDPLAMPGQTQQLQVNGLESNTEYYFSVWARDDDDVRLRLIETFDKKTGEFQYSTTDAPPTDKHVSNRGLPDGVGKTAGERAFLGPAKTSDRDTTPPVIPSDFAITSTTHKPNLVTNVTDIVLSWPAVTDSSAVKFHYALLTKAPSESPFVHNGSKSTGSTTVTLANTPPNSPSGSPYYFYLEVCSQGGCASQIVNYGPILIEAPAGSPDPGSDPDTEDPVKTAADHLEDINQAMTMTVTRDGNTNTVRWVMPSTTALEALGCSVEGVQVWFAPAGATAFTELATILKDEQAFADQEYTHSGPDALRTARYKVTVFACDDDTGRATDPAADIPGFGSLAEATAGSAGPVTGADDGGIPWWVWLIIGLVAIAIIGTVVGVLVMRRGGAGEDGDFDMGDYGGDVGAESGDTWGGDEGLDIDGGDGGDTWGDVGGEEIPAAEPAIEEPVGEAVMPGAVGEVPEEPEPQDDFDPLLHHLTCPSCGADFTAHGEKPMVTECPSCGVKGVLR